MAQYLRKSASGNAFGKVNIFFQHHSVSTASN